MKSIVHAIAGTMATLTIAIFLTLTIYSEIFGTEELIVVVKNAIVFPGLVVLVPLMILTGGLGRLMTGKRVKPAIAIKMKRMKIIGALGIFILVPSALLLAYLANIGSLGLAFYSVQFVEIAAGATNFTLMSKNLLDGMVLSGRLRSFRRLRTSQSAAKD